MKAEQTLKAIVLAVAVALMVLQVWVLLFTPYVNHDVALTLTAGARIAAGGMPYVDVIDTNPPTAFYLSALPALLARMLGIQLAAVGFVFWATLVVASTVFILWLIRRVFPERSFIHTLVIAAFLIAANLHVYSSAEFAQRDHMIILWLIAFSFVRYARYEGTNLPSGAAIAAGIAAGLALAMKPQYAILPLSVELVLLFWHRKLIPRWRDREILAGVAVAALFLLHLFVLPGVSQNAAYWLKNIALGYGAYNTEDLASVLRQVFSSRADLVSLIVCLSLAWLAVLGRKSAAFKGASIIGILGVASFVVMLLQHKGWMYHLVPYRLCALVGLGFLVSDLAALSRRKYWIIAIGTAGLLISPFTIATRDTGWLIDTLSSGRLGKFTYNDFADVIDSLTKPGESVMFISSSVLPAFPAITYADRALAGRLTVAFPIAFAYHGTSGYELPAQWKELEARFLRMLFEDIRNEKPALLFISSGEQPALPRDFVIREYLKRQGFDDTLRTEYASIGSYRKFELRIRTPQLTDPEILQVVNSLRSRGLLVSPGDTSNVNR